MTSRSPLKLFWFSANIICIISRALFFGFLSSLSNAPSTWQCSQRTPSADVMNCIAGII